MTTPIDPLYALQWHFDALGNGRGRGLLERVWDEFTGAGVHVIVYDNGIETAHHDLDGNYDASRELVIGGTPVPVEPQGTTPADSHGTAIAGILAAENNGAGTVGVAWGASLTSAAIFNLQYTETAERLHLGSTFDITSNSWAYLEYFDVNFGLLQPGNSSAALAAEFQFLSEFGRGGLGTINVNGAANNARDANGLGMNTSRHTITVAAIRDDGFAASYSNGGACILVSAPSGDAGPASDIVTTDLLGVAGANFFASQSVASDYMDWASGTSSATPMVSAVAALMLDANPGLGWRDVQNILALTAFHTGSAFGAGPGLNEEHTWFFNEADNWNGGGLHFSEDYGYGNVDPFGAVRMAEAFAVMQSAAQTTANEHFYFNTATPGAALVDNGTYFFDFNVSTFPLTIEHADITFQITHGDYGSLRLFLVSAEGTEVQLYRGGPDSGINATAGFNWIYGVDALRGEGSSGTWRLKIVDTALGNTGTLDSVRIDLFGSAPDSANDAYHFTDEYAEVRALDVTRGALSDLDGGVDWIDAAAVSTNSTINLNAGAAGMIDGAAFAITVGSTIENVIAGDGADRLTGNSGANILHGMRGNDILVGGNGNDTLNGGTGNDSITGGLGNDTYFVDAAGDTVVEASGPGSGTDTVRTTLSTYNLGANVERLVKEGASNFTAAGNILDNNIAGNDGDDRFRDWVGGADRFTGGLGFDGVYYTGAAAAVINMATGVHGGSALGDIFTSIEKFYGSDTGGDTMTAGASRAIFFGQGGNDTLTGAANIDSLFGGAGIDTVNGGGGADLIQGGANNDTLTGGAARDTFQYTETVASGGWGADTITDYQDNFDRLRIDNAIADDVSDFTITGNGTATVVLTLIALPSSTITLQSAAGNITVTNADFTFF